MPSWIAYLAIVAAFCLGFALSTWKLNRYCAHLENRDYARSQLVSCLRRELAEAEDAKLALKALLRVEMRRVA